MREYVARPAAAHPPSACLSSSTQLTRRGRSRRWIRVVESSPAIACKRGETVRHTVGVPLFSLPRNLVCPRDGARARPCLPAARSTQTLRQLIFSVFKTLTDQRVTVELKNDLAITGTLKSVDQCVSPPHRPVSR
jgi:hypothetical protein